MLSWEYPPLVVGGLGRHVEALSRELVRAGHEVWVVTRGEKDEQVDELVDGVHIRRAAVDPLAIDFTTETLLAWAQAGEHALLRAALPLLRLARPEVVHAHDWLVAQSAITLAGAAKAPLVATIHATEAGRHQGWLPAPLNRAINSVESWLARSADEVITCSRALRAETARLFGLDADEVHVVPNGIDVARWRAMSRAGGWTRSDLGADGPLIAFAGRLVHEKGVQTLLAALPRVRRRYRGTRVVIAGTGPHEGALREQARTLRVTRSVEWLGFVPEPQVAALLGTADVAVVPSLYEPFGLIPLEAAAAGTPAIVSASGGLADLHADGLAVASFPPGDVAALADAIDSVLSDAEAPRRAVARALRVMRRGYSWPAIAEATAGVYRGAGARSAR